MTIAASTNRKDYVTLEGQTTFPFDFLILADTDLLVYVDDILQTLNTHYTISEEDVGDPAGGDVVFVDPLVAGQRVALLREMPSTQTADYTEGGRFAAETHERALDKLTILVQQLGEKTNRVPSLPKSSPLGPLALPTPGAGYVIRWNMAGTALEAVNITPESIPLATLLNYTQATLPAPGVPGRIVRLTDGTRGIRVDTGPRWASLTGAVIDVVRDFLADPTGVTNSTAAFAAALAALPPRGVLTGPAGATYLLDGDAQLDVTAPYATVDMRGALFTVTDSSSYGNWLFRALTGDWITFRDMRFDCSGWTTAGAGAYSFAIWVDASATHCTAENCIFSNLIAYRVPVRLDGARAVSRHNKFFSTGGGAMLAGDWSTSENDYAEDPYDAPFVINGAAHSKIVNPRGYSTRAIGPAMIAIEQGATYWTVDNPTIYTSKSPTLAVTFTGGGAVLTDNRGQVRGGILRTLDDQEAGLSAQTVTLDAYAKGITFTDVEIIGTPGALNCPQVQCFTQDIEFRGCRLRTAATCAFANIQALAGTGFLKVYDCELDSLSRAVYLSGTDYTGATLHVGRNVLRNMATGYALGTAENLTIVKFPDRYVSVGGPISLPAVYTWRGTPEVGYATAGATLGTLTNKVPYYNASGVLMGYLPVYDLIT